MDIVRTNADRLRADLNNLMPAAGERHDAGNMAVIER